MGLGSVLAQAGDGVAALGAFRRQPSACRTRRSRSWRWQTSWRATPMRPCAGPTEAVGVAGRGVELTRRNDPVALVTLSIAHAAAGDLRQATLVGKEALAVARRSGPSGLVQAIEARLESYRQGGR